MADDSSTSLGYSRSGTAWPKSRLGKNSYLQCIAIAEVAKAPGVPITPNPYYVVASDEYIMLRCFFVLAGAGMECYSANDLGLDNYV
jgi:hypothetical protein